jgi:hypothetical protein
MFNITFTNVYQAKGQSVQLPDSSFTAPISFAIDQNTGLIYIIDYLGSNKTQLVVIDPKSGTIVQKIEPDNSLKYFFRKDKDDQNYKEFEQNPKRILAGFRQVYFDNEIKKIKVGVNIRCYECRSEAYPDNDSVISWRGKVIIADVTNDGFKNLTVLPDSRELYNSLPLVNTEDFFVGVGGNTSVEVGDSSIQLVRYDRDFKSIAPVMNFGELGRDYGKKHDAYFGALLTSNQQNDVYYYNKKYSPILRLRFDPLKSKPSVERIKDESRLSRFFEIAKNSSDLNAATKDLDITGITADANHLYVGIFEKDREDSLTKVYIQTYNDGVFKSESLVNNYANFKRSHLVGIYQGNIYFLHQLESKNIIERVIIPK